MRGEGVTHCEVLGRGECGPLPPLARLSALRAARAGGWWPCGDGGTGLVWDESASGPASSGTRSMQPSARRMAWEPTALTLLHRMAPSWRASSIAANVSAVSPDWLMASTTVFSSTSGSR